MISVILVAGGAYATLGLLFAASFLLRGIARVDSAARGASWLVKLLLMPGVVALWPLLASQWLEAERRAAAAPVARPPK